MIRKPKILMTSPGKNNYRKTRYSQRQRNASDLGLNFRYQGEPVRQHGVRILLLKELGYKTMHHGVCMVCGQNAPCGCEIQIQKIEE